MWYSSWREGSEVVVTERWRGLECTAVTRHGSLEGRFACLCGVVVSCLRCVNCALANRRTVKCVSRTGYVFVLSN